MTRDVNPDDAPDEPRSSPVDVPPDGTIVTALEDIPPDWEDLRAPWRVTGPLQRKVVHPGYTRYSVGLYPVLVDTIRAVDEDSGRGWG
jgi:hypothetical protein